MKLGEVSELSAPLLHCITHLERIRFAHHEADKKLEAIEIDTFDTKCRRKLERTRQIQVQVTVGDT